MSLVPLPSVPLWGFAAHLVAQTMRSAEARGDFERLHASDRRRLVQLIEDLGVAEEAWREYRETRNGRTETPEAEIQASSEPCMAIPEAAAALQLTPRRVRMLAAAGLGRKRDGRWQLERAAVLREAERRQESSNGD